jgi:hypothetical protein
VPQLLFDISTHDLGPHDGRSSCAAPHLAFHNEKEISIHQLTSDMQLTFDFCQAMLRPKLHRNMPM